MAEQISLRAYIDNLETMLRQSRVDEAIAHSTHILESYPKNAAVYRNLGRALMRQQRHDEASEIFRRLLAAVLDDFSAHYQLSIVYEKQGRSDAALWHIERAFDQQPNNKQVNDRMRELYKTLRNVEVDKIQLTAGAVAKQYLKSDMYDEALDVIDRTLSKLPDRTDLQLIRASTLWESGQIIEAAEAALDILESFPYALEANRIMSELWIEQDRPTDAQRFLIRVDAIDPYLAYEIATNTNANDTHYQLSVLDFSQYAAKLASADNVPDWLQQVEDSSMVETVDDSDVPQIDAFSADIDEANAIFDLDTGELTQTDDALSWIDEMDDDGQPPEPPAKPVTADLSDLLPDDFTFPSSAGADDTISENDLANLPDFEDDNEENLLSLFDEDNIDDTPIRTGLTGMLGEANTDDTPNRTGLTGLLGEDNIDDTPNRTGLTGLLGEDNTDDGDSRTGLTGLLGEDNYSPTNASGLTGLLDRFTQNDNAQEEEIDDLSWLDAATTGEFDTQANDPITNFFDEINADEEENDPMAWLGDDDSIELNEPDDQPIASVDPDNPLAWMQDSGIEIEDNEAVNPLDFEDNDPISLESQESDPMAWLGDSDIEVEGDAQDTYSMGTVQFDDAGDDPMAWLEDNERISTDDISHDEDDSMAWMEEPDFVAEETGDLSDPDDSMAWLSDAGIEISDETDSNEILTGQLQNLDDSPVDDEEDPLAWLEDDGVEFLEDDTAEAEDDEAWLNDDNVLDDLLNIADLTNTSDSDSILEEDAFLDTNDTDSQDELPWMTEDSTTVEEDLDWLEEGGLELGDDISIEDAAPVEEDPMAWLGDSDIELDDEQDPADDMAWMADESDAVAENELDWMSEDTVDSIDSVKTDPDPASGTTGLLDFLGSDNAVGDIDLDDLEFDEDELFDDGNTGWLDALDVDTSDTDDVAAEIGWDTDEEEDTVAENELDWMADDSASDDGFEWDTEETDDAEEFWEADSPVQSSYADTDEPETDTMDWMAEMTDEPTNDFNFGEDDDNQSDDLDWMADLTDDDETDAQPAEADWLSELGDDDADDGFNFDDETDAQPAEADWLSELGDDADDDFGFDEDDAEAQPAEADWLSELGDDDADDDFGFDEDDAEAQPAEADWLSELGDDDADDDFGFDEDDAEAQPAEADWLSELGDDDADDDFGFDEDDAEAQPAEADWLSELGDDDADDDFGFDDDETDAQPAEVDWLSELGDDDDDDDDDFGFDEDDAEAQPAEADWLSELGDDDADDDFGFDEEQEDALDEMDLMAELNEEPLAEEADPLAWMEDKNIEIESDEPAIDAIVEFDDPNIVEAEALASSEQDDPMAWLNEEDHQADIAEPAEADWMAELSDEEEESFSEFEFDAEAEDDFADFDFDEEEIEEADPVEVDWLSSVDEEDEEEDWGVSKTGFTDKLDPDVVAQAEAPAVRSFTDRLNDYEDDTAEEQEEDWLSDVGVVEEDEWAEEDFDEYYGEDLNVSTKGMSEMLDSIRTTRDDDLETTLDEFEADEPDWLKATGEFIQPVVEDDSEETEFIDDQADDMMQEEEAIPAVEAKDAFELLEARKAAEDAAKADVFGEQTEQADADNAPDWLNAMVPGLDLDFEAEDEGHLDEGFDEREQTLRERNISDSEQLNADFDWLQDIVEEETGLMDAVEVDDNSTPPPPMDVPMRRSYDFSAPPVWARGDTLENIAQPTATLADELPDYLSGFDDEFDDDISYEDDIDDAFEFETDEMQMDDTSFNVEDDIATTQNDALDVSDESFGFDDDEFGDDFDDEFDDEFPDFGDELDDEFDDEFPDFDDDFDFDDESDK